MKRVYMCMAISHRTCPPPSHPRLPQSPTTAPYSNDAPVVFQELDANFFKDPELTLLRHVSVHVTRLGQREAPTAQWESRRRLDWSWSLAILVDLGLRLHLRPAYPSSQSRLVPPRARSGSATSSRGVRAHSRLVLRNMKFFPQRVAQDNRIKILVL